MRMTRTTIGAQIVLVWVGQLEMVQKRAQVPLSYAGIPCFLPRCLGALSPFILARYTDDGSRVFIPTKAESNQSLFNVS